MSVKVREVSLCFLILLVQSCIGTTEDVQVLKPATGLELGQKAKSPIHAKEQIQPDELDKILEAEEQLVEEELISTTQKDIKPNNPKEASEPQATKAEISDDTSTSDGAIRLANHPMVKKWLKYFTGKGRDRFERYMSRGLVYRERIEKILVDNGVPKDLYYLALVESGFVNRARSRVGAVGLWQFIKGTAHRYGLRVSRGVDERQDPIRATVSASLYLRDLRNVFNHWYLAMGAYNAGEMRIMRAIMKANTRDFWQLVAEKRLPRETMNYVPKIIAAKIIGENLQQYGFEVTPSAEPLSTQWESVRVPASISLASIAKTASVSKKILFKNNPHLRRGRIPSGRRPYRLWVASQQKVKIAANLEKLSKQVIAQKRSKRNRNNETLSQQDHESVYKVRWGDTISGIARRYRVGAHALKRLNRLNSNRVYVGQKLRIPSESFQKLAKNAKKIRVKRGDTIASLSKIFGVSVASIKAANGMRSSRIYAGQILKISNNAGYRRYRVRRGDNLHLIARRFGTSVANLKQLNSLKKNTIYAGQMLKIRHNKS